MAIISGPGGGGGIDSSVASAAGGMMATHTRSHRHGSISSSAMALTSAGATGSGADGAEAAAGGGAETPWQLASQQAEVKLDSIRRDTLRETDYLARRAKERKRPVTEPETERKSGTL
jgi:hypothetical protein